MTSHEPALEQAPPQSEGEQFWAKLTDLAVLQRQIGDVGLTLSSLVLLTGEEGQRLLEQQEATGQPLSADRVRSSDDLLRLGANAIDQLILENKSLHLRASLRSDVSDLTRTYSGRTMRVTSTTDEPLPLRRSDYHLGNGNWEDAKRQPVRHDFVGLFDWIQIGDRESHVVLSRRFDLISYSKYHLALPCTPEQAAAVSVQFTSHARLTRR